MTHSHKPSLASFASLDGVKWHIQALDNKACTTKKVSNKGAPAPWSEALITQVSLFSQYLLKDQKAKHSPELVALGYWCRKSNLKHIQKDFTELSSTSDVSYTHENKSSRIALGKVFHIAPANVDTVFFYSLILSVLSGNQNIVRISERSGDLCRLLINTLQRFLQQEKTPLLTHLISIVEYSATHTEATKLFSQWCDLRLIWGGDSAIEAISAIEPQTQQVCFPDRFSIAVMQLTGNDINNIPNVATQFIADLQPFNQQACSSPKALFWLNTPAELQQAFYNELHKQLKVHQQQYGLSEQVERQINYQQLLLSEKLDIASQHFTEQLGIAELGAMELDSLELAKSSSSTDESVTINANLLNKHKGNGLLLVSNINELTELPFDEKLQTIAEYGVSDNLLENLQNVKAKRITKIGTVLAFKWYWDGVPLLLTLTSLNEKL